MNREDAYKKIKVLHINDIQTSGLHIIIDNIYDEFEKDLKDINNQVLRLKKQLSKGHHTECSCSFDKPVNEA